jgi:hypothetical protein
MDMTSSPQDNPQPVTDDSETSWLHDYDEQDTSPALLHHLPIQGCDGKNCDVDCGNDGSVYTRASGKNCDVDGYLKEAKALHESGYSPHILFAGMMIYYWDDITADILQKFIEYGLDINKAWPVYQNPKDEVIKPIAYAVEQRRIELIRLLLNAGAKVDDPCGINSVINIALYGLSDDDHDAEDDHHDWKTCEIIVEMLDIKGAPKQILQWVRDECCDTYIHESEYLRDYIASCKIIEVCIVCVV